MREARFKKIGSDVMSCIQSLVLGLLAGAIMPGFILADRYGFIPKSEREVRSMDGIRAGDHRRLVGIYNAVNLGEDLAVVARKVIEHIGWRMLDVSFDEVGGDANLHVAYSKSRVFEYSGKFYGDYGRDKWVLTLCFADGQLEGVHFGTDSAVGVTPDAAPSPKGECARSLPPPG